MNKNLLLSLCLGTVAAVSAQANASNCQINSGAYAGISAGISAQSGKSNFVNSDDAGGVVNDIPNNSLSKTSPAAAIFGGYGMKFGSFWTAAELFYQFDKLNVKHDMTLNGNSGNEIQSSSAGAYGAAVHLGFMPANNCVAYAILGLEVRSFKVKFADTIAPYSTSAVINKKYTSIAFAPGIGMRFGLTKNLSIRTEYKCAMHRSKKSTNTNIRAGVTETATIKNKPQIHSLNIGLVYSF